MHSNVTIKNVSWPHFSWPTLYMLFFCLLAERRLGPRHWPPRTYGHDTTDDVLYNKFNVDSSSPPQSPSKYQNTDYNCAVATTGQWRVARCTEQHVVVCQSVYDTSPGTHSYFDNIRLRSQLLGLRICAY